MDDLLKRHRGNGEFFRKSERASLKWKLSVATGLCLASTSQLAHAKALFVPGSTFQVDASNSPGSFDRTVSLAPGTTLLDRGALSLTLSIVPSGRGSEWLVFDFNTTGGGPLSAPGDDWSVSQVGLDAAQPVYFNQGYYQFDQNGVALAPTSSIFSCCGVKNNPVPGQTGTGLGNDHVLAVPYPAGPLPSYFASITPFSYLGTTGINYRDVNGYETALQFSPQTAVVPEPPTWVMMLLGFAGLGYAGYPSRKKSRSPIAAA
jgi:hypothetical protein